MTIKKIIFLLLLFIPTQVFAWTGVVEKVIDGDSLNIMPADGKDIVKVRLYGIDAPEWSQPYGNKASAFLRSLCEGKSVIVVDLTIDRYGRTIAVVILGNKSLQEILIHAGYAWLYQSHYKSLTAWKALEEEAMRNKSGLWAGSSPIPPWDWKKRK